MALPTKFTRMAMVLLFCTTLACFLPFCSVFMKENSDCVAGYGCYYVQVEMLNRKLLSKKEVVVESELHASSSHELRMVPSGPDPLHHNSSPKKPRTP
ncbi:hypothetical protein Patl1_30317 [Pistacia atlantica]|uniref:Uncharacterized protein n=1 Tax=Pistacia atlantica TaxID=434234 RepID=A0ACC1AER9_9ROSI|nr:hypothetical protein Patl1_30317 [Pistacia atlantica]